MYLVNLGWCGWSCINTQSQKLLLQLFCQFEGTETMWCDVFVCVCPWKLSEYCPRIIMSRKLWHNNPGVWRGLTILIIDSQTRSSVVAMLHLAKRWLTLSTFIIRQCWVYEAEWSLHWASCLPRAPLLSSNNSCFCHHQDSTDHRQPGQPHRRPPDPGSLVKHQRCVRVQRQGAHHLSGLRADLQVSGGRRGKGGERNDGLVSPLWFISKGCKQMIQEAQR